ncbi:hypothetical protein BX666DRAFT_1336299 [Dichotomocladium elegans]|nr:hypothetical protein BX666DRAFT_1336299 [Dichotomocladium elegans]
MLNELHMRSTHVDSLCHELYLTLTHAYDWRIRYLQHLAGTLARAPPAPITPTDRPSNFDDVMTFTECEHGLTQKTSELRSFKANEAARSHEWKALIEVERLQSELSQLHAQVDQLKQRELDQQRHIQDLTRTFQLHEAEFELEIVTLRQAHDAHAKLTAAKVGLEEALKAAQVREIESLARHMEATEHLEQRYQALEAELKEREIRPLQEALDQTRRREMELVTQLQHQQQREADIISEIEEHVERIHTLETQVEQLQKQVTRNAEEKAFLEATAELIAEEKSASEEQLEQALAATSCVSLDDMVSQLQVFASAQEEFTRREAAMMLQQASVEAELGLLLKEYDRLTRSIHDSQLDRRHYESQILVLTQEKQALAKEVMDYRIKQGIGLDGQTTTLRKEFRQLMAAVKEEHDEAIKKEVEQRQTVANELRDLKHDLEMKCWDRVSTGVQTAFVAYPGVVQ